MTVFLLIRHALCDPVGRAIAGRAPGLHLNQAGRVQAEALAKSLSRVPLRAVYSSPLERTRETAEPIAAVHGLTVQSTPGLNEVDFGTWTGRSLAELAPIPEWKEFNASRATARIPGGETMGEVVKRGLLTLERIRSIPGESGGVVALVSHGDVLRGLITHCLGLHMDLLHRLEVSPASVSVLSYEESGPRLLLLNWTPQHLADVAPSWV